MGFPPRGGNPMDPREGGPRGAKGEDAPSPRASVSLIGVGVSSSISIDCWRKRFRNLSGRSWSMSVSTAWARLSCVAAVLYASFSTQC
eukprot:2911816-Pyramimonas_sp.AAC.1